MSCLVTMPSAPQTSHCAHVVGVSIQAEKESMEQQLEALTAQLESMKAKNIETAGHNSTLGKAIVFKDYEVAKLQESNHVSPACSICLGVQISEQMGCVIAQVFLQSHLLLISAR